MTKGTSCTLTLAFLITPFLLVGCGGSDGGKDGSGGDAARVDVGGGGGSGPDARVEDVSPAADTPSAVDAASVDGTGTPDAAVDAATRDGAPLVDASADGSGDGPEGAGGANDAGVDYPSADAPAVFPDPTDALLDDALPPRQRLAVVVAVEEEYRRALVQYATPLEQIRAIGKFMAGRSEYSRVLVDEEDLSITGELQNGWIHFVGNTPSWRAPADSMDDAGTPDPAASPQTTYEQGGGQTAAPAQPQGPPGPAFHAGAGAANPLPATNHARLINGFENFGMPELNSTPELIRSMLKKAGWEVQPGASASVEALAQVGGDGFFYFQGHGGYGRWWDAAEANYHCLQTSTLDDTSKYTAYQDDLDKHRLALITEKTFDQNWDPSSKAWKNVVATWFGITNLWVETHWGAFSDDAVVVLNACNSGRAGSASSSLFVEACRKKGNPNAVFGWSKSVDGSFALKAVSYLVDRCVGANTWQKEKIAQRPFPRDAVLKWMHDNNKDRYVDAEGNLVQLLPSFAKADSALLAPTIRQVIVDEYAQEMKLYGAFGSDEGQVMVGKTACAVKPGEWASDKITCTLPSEAKGDVVVEVRKLKSNPRPLTEWQFPIKYTWSSYFTADPVVMFSSANSIRYRMDVSGYREKPGETPTYPKLGTWPVTESSMKIIGSGTGPLASCTATLTGSVDFPTIPAKTYKPDFFLQAPLLVDTASKTGALGLVLGLPKSTGTNSPWKLIVCGGSVDAAPTFGNLQTQMSFPQSSDENAPYIVPSPALSLSFGTDFEILTSSFSSAAATGGTIQVVWPTTAPTSPPDPNADGI
jgi:hypothetical protein